MSDDLENGYPQWSDIQTASVEAGNGTAVQIEEFPGGDMMVYISDGESMYFTSCQAAALRSALDQIDDQKNAPEVVNDAE